VRFQCIECDKRFEIPDDIVKNKGAGSHCPKCRGETAVIPSEPVRARSTRWHKVDNRRSKTYQAVATYKIEYVDTFGVDEAVHSLEVPTSVRAAYTNVPTFQAALESYFDGASGEGMTIAVAIHSKGHAAFFEAGSPYVVLTVYKTVPKPSLIPDKKGMDTLVTKCFPEGLRLAVNLVLRRCIIMQKNALEITRVHETAKAACNKIVTIASKKSRRVCRFHQRLAALVAEVNSEFEMQMQDLLTIFEEGPEDGETDAMAGVRNLSTGAVYDVLLTVWPRLTVDFDPEAPRRHDEYVNRGLVERIVEKRGR